MDLNFKTFKIMIMYTSDIYVIRHTGMLGGLVGSLTKVAIYPTYAICCKRLWSMPAPDTKFEWHKVVNYLANLQTT